MAETKEATIEQITPEIQAQAFFASIATANLGAVIEALQQNHTLVQAIHDSQTPLQYAISGLYSNFRAFYPDYASTHHEHSPERVPNFMAISIQLLRWGAHLAEIEESFTKENIKRSNGYCCF